MPVDILAAHGRLGGLDFKLATEITRLVKSCTLLRRDPIGGGNLLHHLRTSSALRIHPNGKIRRLRLEFIQTRQQVARLLRQAANRVLIALDTAFAPLNRPLKLLAPAVRRVILLPDE